MARPSFASPDPLASRGSRQVRAASSSGRHPRWHACEPRRSHAGTRLRRIIRLGRCPGRRACECSSVPSGLDFVPSVPQRRHAKRLHRSDHEHPQIPPARGRRSSRIRGGAAPGRPGQRGRARRCLLGSTLAARPRVRVVAPRRRRRVALRHGLAPRRHGGHHSAGAHRLRGGIRRLAARELARAAPRPAGRRGGPRSSGTGGRGRPRAPARDRRDRLSGRRGGRVRRRGRRQGSGLARGRRGRLVGRIERDRERQAGHAAGHLDVRRGPGDRHHRDRVPCARALVRVSQPLLPAQGRALVALGRRTAHGRPQAGRTDDHGQRDPLAQGLLPRRHDRRGLQRCGGRPRGVGARRAPRRHDRSRRVRHGVHPVHRRVRHGCVCGGACARIGGTGDRGNHAGDRPAGERPAPEHPAADRVRRDARAQPARRPHRDARRRRALRHGGARARRAAHVGGGAHQRRPCAREGGAAAATAPGTATEPEGAPA